MERAAVHSLQVVWLTAVSFGTYRMTLPPRLKPIWQLLLTRASHRPQKSDIPACILVQR